MNTLTTDKWNKVNEAIDKISALGYKVEKINKGELHFFFKNKKVIYYPIKEWATGSSINDCRGLGKLLNQIKPIGVLSVASISDIKNKITETIEFAKSKSAEFSDSPEIRNYHDGSVDSLQFILDFINGEQ